MATKAQMEKEIAELKEQVAELEKAAKDVKPVPSLAEQLDLDWLPAKNRKGAEHFLERICFKRQCSPERALAFVLQWCAIKARTRHGLHHLVQIMERESRCKL